MRSRQGVRRGFSKALGLEYGWRLELVQGSNARSVALELPVQANASPAWNFQEHGNVLVAVPGSHIIIGGACGWLVGKRELIRRIVGPRLGAREQLEHSPLEEGEAGHHRAIAG